MASGHLTYNREYLKHREALDYWDAWVLRDVHVSRSPSKLASKRKGRKKRNADAVLCPVCGRHGGRCFIHLLTSFNLHNNSMRYRVTEEDTGVQRE